MFLVVQFPFADVRQFVPDDTHRLTVPTWPNAADGKEFVRGYGPVSRRPRGGVDYWAGERLFCPTARTLRFAGSPRSLRVAVSGRPMPFDCEFRRFFTNGQALCRVEIGLTQRTDRATVSAGLKWVSRNGQFRGNQPLTAAECVDVVRGILKWPIRVRQDAGKMKDTELGSAGSRLAHHYLSATTQRDGGKPRAVAQWWCSAGAPLVVVEHAPGELTLPRGARPVRTLSIASIQLAYVEIPGSSGAWFLGTDAPGGDIDLVRRLRIHLNRLHSERECMKQVLRLIAQQRLSVVAGTPSYDLLQQYLADAGPLLAREWREGLPQADILKAAYESDWMISEDERADLLAALRTARVTVLRKVTQLTESPVVVNIQSFRGSIGGTTTMTDKSVHINNSTVTNSNVVIGDAIQSVTNTITQAPASDELKQALLQLTRTVEQMAAQLPKEKQQEVAQDLRTLTEETTKPAPRRAWYELSANGLIEAAQAVAGLGPPVVEAVKVVLGLVGGAVV